MTRDQEVHVPAFKAKCYADTKVALVMYDCRFPHYYVQSGDVEAALKSRSLCRFQRHRERYAIILSEY